MGRTPSSSDLDAKADMLRELIAEANGSAKDLRAARAETIGECKALLTSMVAQARDLVDKAVNRELAQLAEVTQASMKRSEDVVGERVEAAMLNISEALADRLGEQLTEIYQRNARRTGINAHGRIAVDPDDMHRALTSDDRIRFNALPVLPRPGTRGRPAPVPPAFGGPEAEQ